MKKVFFLLFVLTVAIRSTAANVELYEVAATQGLNLRTQMTAKSGIISKLPKGEVVEVLQKTTTKRAGFVWFKVKARGKIGFAASEFLKKLGVPPPPPPSDEEGDNDVSKVYWMEGNKLSSELMQKLNSDWTNEFKADKVAAMFRLYAQKTKALNQDLVYPEMIDYVNRVSQHYNLIANKVSGSNIQYGKKAIEYTCVKLLNVAEKWLGDKIHSHALNMDEDSVWIEKIDKQELEKEYKTLVEAEKTLVQSMRQKHGLRIQLWE